MAQIVLGLQGGIANGSESTFDGQPMQPGVHLRWSFLAALGFPPGGFWLCRRALGKGERQFPPPPTQGCGEGQSSPTASSSSLTASLHTAATTTSGSNPWERSMSTPCQSVTLAGCASPGCDEVIIETFSRDAKGELHVSGRRAVRVEQGCFRVSVQACEISCVRVMGAERVDECGCAEPLPKDCNCGGDTGGAGGSNPPCYGEPGWGPPNDSGWQCWGVPFTLPITMANWPARYYGAPSPATTSASAVEQHDIDEAIRRLGSLRLEASLTAAEQRDHLKRLRAELVRLVQGFPSTLLAEVPLHPSPAGANAPQISLDLMDQLLLLALDPYFARVLGLYFVDTKTAPGVRYAYAITGYWGATPSKTDVLYPGLTPGSQLARGTPATFNGLTIEPQGGSTTLWRWTKYDIHGNYLPRLDPTALPGVAPAVANGLAGLTQADQPDALLCAATLGFGFPFPSPPPLVSISLSQPVPRVDAQVAGTGTVYGLSNGTIVSSSFFSSAQLSSVIVTAADPAHLIDGLEVVGQPAVSTSGVVVVIGSLQLHPLSPDAIGTRYAIVGPPVAIASPPAPGQPLSTFRHRQADVDPATLTLAPHSLIDVEWPAPPVTAATQPGDPVGDPIDLPPPTQPIGFVAQRQDVGVANSTRGLPGWIATRSTLTPASSKIPTAKLYRLADSGLTDPKGGWSHRVAAFDLFGVRGAWSNWTVPKQVEKIAGAPTAMRIRQFDNTPALGGAPAANGSAWTGGTLNLLVNWSGAAFMMYPDIRTARVLVEGIDSLGVHTGELATADLTVLPAVISKRVVSSIVATPSSDGKTFSIEIQTTPPLPAVDAFDPGQMLQLTLPDGTTERFAIRATNPIAPTPGPIVARIQAGRASRLVTTTSDFLNQTAYLVEGYGVQLTLPVPLSIPITERTARAQVSVTGSTQTPFLAAEQIIDPNGVNPPRPEPQSTRLVFTGAQRLVPPAPPTPVHEVHHVFYDPANVTGHASKTLPFTTPVVGGVSGYVLERSPVRSTALADVKRRLALGDLADQQPVVFDGAVQRVDLVAWINALNDWLTAYNQQNGTALSSADALSDSAAQRAFAEHFYGGLLDDELRALADMPANGTGYARVNPSPLPSGNAIEDSVDGTGFGRTLYRLAAVNAAGSISSTTGSIGPYYTQIVTPPRPPVLYKLQATESAVIVAWALDTNPDVAAYLVYRATAVDRLNDVRFFGADPAHPVPPSTLATIRYNQQSWPPLSFVQALDPSNIDPRMVGFVPDPRLCARDYASSDMGEIVLPTGPAPDAIHGIYRLAEYDSIAAPTAQIAFNYWTPPATGGIAQLKIDSPSQSRLTGLRIGLGRGVPVVVVATWQGVTRVLGRVPVRRAGFVDGISAASTPLDANTIAGASAPNAAGTNAYVVVALDIYGNRSLPSKPFATQLLAKAYGS